MRASSTGAMMAPLARMKAWSDGKRRELNWVRLGGVQDDGGRVLWIT